MKSQAQFLTLLSGIALIAAPTIALMGAFQPSQSMIALTLIIMGGLGLFAGMKATNRLENNS